MPASRTDTALEQVRSGRSGRDQAEVALLATVLDWTLEHTCDPEDPDDSGYAAWSDTFGETDLALAGEGAPGGVLGGGAPVVGAGFPMATRRSIGLDRRMASESELPVLVAAGVIVKSGDKVLLQRRSDNGQWGIPGGGLEPGETLEQTARRELLEETGLQAGELRLLDVYSGPEFLVHYPDGFAAYVVGATFEARGVTGALHADGDESLELRWVELARPIDLNPFNRALLARVGLVPKP